MGPFPPANNNITNVVFKLMSEIKLKRELYTSEKTGVTLDQDDNGFFQRLTLRVVHPITKEPCYMEFNKEDSKNVLIQKEDGLCKGRRY